MKLKVYRISLLACLFISFLLSIYFLVLSIINVATLEKDQMMDGIMYIVCFVLNLCFIGLEIFNTFYSFKTGSHFAKNLAFNDDNSLNKKFLIIISFVNVLVLVGLVYMCIIYKGVEGAFLNDLSIHAKAVAINFLLTVLINLTYTLLFPILGKDDISLQANEKTSS